MKTRSEETVTTAVATYVGKLIDMDWASGEGVAELDAPPGVEPVEVPCRFRYMGRHWIWQQARGDVAAYTSEDIEAYPDEDAASHSAFAFCLGDRVVLLHKPMEAEAAAADREAGGDGKEYVAVAVLSPEGDRVVKRNPWPMYRLGHEAWALGVGYSDFEGRGRGFPFITDDGTRTPVEPFRDQRGHWRALGTDGGSGNTRVVVTREREADENGGDDRVHFVPHAVHEFAGPGEGMPYVPDVLMQTAPNWKGRIIGWSAEDEILIDNIPVARVVGIDPDTELERSWKAETRKFVYVSAEERLISVLYVTMDCNFDWRHREKSGNPGGAAAEAWYPPKYAFHCQIGVAIGDDLLCPYEAMETPREELPVIQLETDEELSWTWQALQAQEPNYILDNRASNLMDGAVEMMEPGKMARMCFHGGVGMASETVTTGLRRIGVTIGLTDEGAWTVGKELGPLEAFSPLNTGNLDAYAEIGTRDNDEKYVAEDHATLAEPVREVAAWWNDEAALVVEIEGHDDYEADASGSASYDTELTKRYIHWTADSEFVIAEETQTITGGGDDAETTQTVIVFTRTDLREGVYGFWEGRLLDGVRPADIVAEDADDFEARVTWRHWIVSATARVMTHERIFDVPGGSDDDAMVNRLSVARLARFRELNNPGTSGFHPETHYTHNVWILPRFRIGDTELTEGMWYLDEASSYWGSAHDINIGTLGYRKYVFYPGRWSAAIENEIYNWFQGTTWKVGTKRRNATLVKTPMYNFSMHPFGSKNVGVWPYARNVCGGYPGEFVESPDFLDANRFIGGILFSECMEYDGASFGGGSFVFSVLAKGASRPALAFSPDMERLLTCTGRGDMVISLK